MQALAETPSTTPQLPSLVKYSARTQQQSALARLAKLEKFPPQKPNHEIYDAVYTPLPRLRQALSIDQQEHVKWRVDEDAEFELSRILTSQPYVYPLEAQVVHPAPRADRDSAAAPRPSGGGGRVYSTWTECAS